MEKWKGTYIENFLDAVKLLPNDLSRTAALIGELDSKADAARRELDMKAEEFIAQANLSEGRPPDLQLLRDVRVLQQEIHRLHTEKVALTDQSRDMVTSFTARLDKDLLVFEQELGPNVPVELPLLPPKPKKEKRREPLNPSYYLAINPPPRAPDPNEAVYCYCKQVSHELMVACDGQDCPFNGWFHYKCVGLRKPPPKESKWYCVSCAPPGWKDLFTEKPPRLE